MARCECVVSTRCLEMPCTVAGVFIIVLTTVFLLLVQDSRPPVPTTCSSEASNTSTTGSAVKVVNNATFGFNNTEPSSTQKRNYSAVGISRDSHCVPKTKFRKCCPENKRFISESLHKCVEVENDPPFLTVFNNSNITNTVDDFLFAYGNPCSWFQELLIRNDTRVSDDCLISAADSKTWDQYDSCFERFVGEDTVKTLVCHTTEKIHIYIVVKSLANITSFMFYLLTFLVYALVPDLHVGFHGKAVMYHVLCMLTQTVVMEISLMPILTLRILIILAYAEYYTVIASFSWLTVMCFDMWQNFRDLERMRHSARMNPRKRHILYSLFAWGYPPAVVLVVLILSTALIEVKRSIEVFVLYLPVALLLFINAMMFLTTWCRLRALDKVSAALESRDSHVHDANRKRYVLFVNLFLIMAAPWAMKVLEIFEYVVDTFFLNLAVAVVTGLQGLLVFFIFVCKRRVIRLIKRRCCHCMRQQEST